MSSVCLMMAVVCGAAPSGCHDPAVCQQQCWLKRVGSAKAIEVRGDDPQVGAKVLGRVCTRRLARMLVLPMLANDILLPGSLSVCVRTGAHGAQEPGSTLFLASAPVADAVEPGVERCCT